MVICHCNNCKKWSGSAFATNIHFPKSALKLENSSRISSYSDGDTETGRTIERYFCSRCGCCLFIIAAQTLDMVNIASGVLNGFVDPSGGNVITADETERLAGLRPSFEVFKEGRCPWVAIKLDE